MALADLAKILELTSSKSSTSSTSSGKTLTAEQVQALIKKALEGTQGLASITGGEKAAGLYNSTVASQLTNDLVSSAAAEAAAQSTASTSTTTQSSPATVNPLVGIGLLGASGLMQEGNLDKIKKLTGSLFGSTESTVPKEEINRISSMLFGDAGTATSGSADSLSSALLDTNSLSSDLATTATASSFSDYVGSMWDSVTDWFK